MSLMKFQLENLTQPSTNLASLSSESLKHLNLAKNESRWGRHHITIRLVNRCNYCVVVVVVVVIFAQRMLSSRIAQTLERKLEDVGNLRWRQISISSATIHTGPNKVCANSSQSCFASLNLLPSISFFLWVVVSWFWWRRRQVDFCLRGHFKNRASRRRFF